MPGHRSHDQLVRAARLYWYQDRSQSDIARELGVSRSSVSRMLAAARARGVVQIHIRDSFGPPRVEELENAISAAFGLGRVRVIARPIGRSPIDIVAESAARFFEEHISAISDFGMSWGKTIENFADHVDVEAIYDSLRISPLVGGLPSDTGKAGNTSAEVVARKAGALSFRFDSPAVVESVESWVALNKESSIQAAIERASRVQLAIVGIGSWGIHSSRRVVAAMQLGKKDKKLFETARPVGDICGRFFDIDGHPIGKPASERVIGVSFEQLGAIEDTIGLAGGSEKANGVIGALRTGILNGIIIDDELARAVLKGLG